MSNNYAKTNITFNPKRQKDKFQMHIMTKQILCIIITQLAIR